jgi:hypothetical protein
VVLKSLCRRGLGSITVQKFIISGRLEPLIAILPGMAAVRRRQTRRPPRYDEEDTRPTTNKELMGWYSYGLAAEVFAVCGVGKYSWVLDSAGEPAEPADNSRLLPPRDVGAIGS